MKKLIGIALAAIVALPAVGASAALPPQEESGTVLFATPHQQDPTICFQGIGRRINMVSQGAVSGPFGAIFDIDKSTWGGKFKMTAEGLTGAEDMDIYFFSSFGEIADDPSMNSPTILTQFQEREAGGEAGVVPPESTKAIACLFSGFGADFTYKASPKKKKR